MDSLLDFSNKVILITGAGSGFGRLLAEGLGSRGAKLVLSDINEENLAACRADVASYTDVVTKAGDIASEALNKALVELAKDKFGRLDIAINNAGLSLIHI